MKILFKQPCSILFTTILALLVTSVLAAEEFVIAKDGQVVASLVLLPNSGKIAEQAAGDLAATLQTITTAKFEIGNELQQTPCVVIGLASEWAKLTKDDAPLKRLAGAAPESFLLLSTPGRLLILGRDSNGASHGVYTILRDLGCRWYFIANDWDVIPRLKDVAVRADRVEGPVLKVRILSNGAGAGASGRLFENWCRRNRLGSAYGPQAVSHSYASFVPKSLFSEHPEYFAWVSKDGDAKGTEQNGEQPCTTHPEVVKMFTEGALAKLRTKKELTGEEPPLISVSPNDGTPNMCRCERCIATGTYGDCALLLANQVAEAIHAEFPNTLVGFLAYGRASALPVKIKQAHPNVLVSIAAGFNWKTSVARLLEEWPKIVHHVTIYEYYAINDWGARTPDNTMPNVEYISQTLRSWTEHGIEGVNGEMENDWATCGHRLWAFAEFAWNPSVKPGAALDDFFANCWGEAAGPIKRYYGRWESGQKASPRVLRLAFRDLEEAARLAKAPAIVRRVDQLSLYLYWHLLNREFKAAKGEDVKNQIALEGDLFQYRWRDAFMVQLVGSIFNVDRPAKIGFTPAEVAALRADAVRRFLPSSDPDVDLANNFSENLVPLRDFQNLKALTACDRDDGVIASASYLFRAKAGEDVQVEFEPVSQGAASTSRQSSSRELVAKPDGTRDQLPTEESAAKKIGRFQLWFLGADGKDQDFVLETNPVQTNGRSLNFAFKAPRDGLYRLNAKIQQGGVHADFKGRPYVLAAQVKSRKNVLPLDKKSNRLSTRESQAAAATRYYFFVPKGTRAFLVEAASPGRKSVTVTFETASGHPIKEAVVDPATECLVQVPVGRDGGIWRLSMNANCGQVTLGGIPPWLATHPENLLIPRELIP